jgi:hypothetical protein
MNPAKTSKAIAAAVLLSTALIAPGVSLAAGDANQASCPEATESSPGFRTTLPDCRAYELMTPPYKEGGVVQLRNPAAVAADGDAVIIGAGGAFASAGNYWFGEAGENLVAYRLSRTAAGWQTAVLTPPASTFTHSILEAAAPEHLETTLWEAGTTQFIGQYDLYLRDASGAFNRVGSTSPPDLDGQEEEGGFHSFVGASRDLTHILAGVTAFDLNQLALHKGHSDLWPGDTSFPGSRSLYEYTYLGHAVTEPKLVGVKNQAALASNTEAQLISDCGTILGSAVSQFNAVSEDGQRVFFTALHDNENGSTCAQPDVTELYARVGGATTVALSQPSPTDCEVCNTTTGRSDVSFEGAAADGQRVFFSTDQSLIPGQEGDNIYEYNFGAPSASAGHPDGKISLVSAGATNPEVQGFVSISQDGSHLYFVAKGVLAGPNAEGHEAQAGADNLYVYEDDAASASGHRVAFVGTLLTEAEELELRPQEEEEQVKVAELASKAGLAAFEEELSHGVSFVEALHIAQTVESRQTELLMGSMGPSGTLAADREAWKHVGATAQATPTGEHLAFLSSARLTPDDSAKVPQLFEYDAANESLRRISIGQGATFANNGNVSTFQDAPQLPPQSLEIASPTVAQSHLAISSDGQVIAFTSAAGLVPQARSGAPSVYEYRDGDVHLLSDGQDTSDTSKSPSVRLFGIDALATDAFFTTAEPLVAPAQNGQQALYDARTDGGFPEATTSPPCSGEACRGDFGATPQLPAPASATQTGGDNVAPQPPSPTPHPPAPPSRAQRLAKALRMCRTQHNRKKPKRRCEGQAKRRYGPVTGKRTSNAHHARVGSHGGSR